MPIRDMTSMEECQRVCTELQNQIIVLDFTATWCGPCKRIYPLLENLSNQYTNIVFYKIDINKLADVAEHFQITSVPSFKFIYNNKIIAEITGADSQKLTKTIVDLHNELINNQ